MDLYEERVTLESHISVPQNYGAVSWFTTPISEACGYQVGASGVIGALMNKSIFVGYNNPIPRVHISYIQPEWYCGEQEQYKIGYTPWESTEIPKAWVHYMQQQNEIWTTSQFNVDTFKEYEVNENIHLVPHAIDPEIWTIHDRTLCDNFNFLHVGGPTERKGAQRVVDAFLDLFDGQSNINLILKSSGVSEARWRGKDFYGGNIVNHPQVTVITETLSDSDLAKLYHKAHCLVYPTNGEGFGFIPFQGIATGLPTIVTNLTSTADFADLSMPLKASWTEGQGIHLGLWADPDLDDLRIQMQSAISDWDMHKKKSAHSARIIHGSQTWSHVADQIIEILGEKIHERI